MRRDLVHYLCDPQDFSPLQLITNESADDVITGQLVSARNSYPIVDGVPRFAGKRGEEVNSFGLQWNYFNYDLFKCNWIEHVVNRNFGSTAFFRNKVIVDCGAGSGMQTKWMAEAGARRVIALELSGSVDGVMKRNLEGLPNVDVVQCSIDQPPIKHGAIENGLIICHNVIQHTPSVEKTAAALWNVLQSGELVFNCYLYRESKLWRLRHGLVYRPLRALLSRCPFAVIAAYAKVVAALRFIPILGFVMEKAQLVVRGRIPAGPNYLHRAYWGAVLNTFDWYGAHEHQHLKHPAELRSLVLTLQQDLSRVHHLEEVCSARSLPGLAIRITKGGVPS